MLRLADRGDYSVVGVPTREVPDTLPDGRALTPTPSWRGRPCRRTSPAPARTTPCARSPAATRSATPRPLRGCGPSGSRSPASLPLDDALRARVGEAVAAATPGWTPLGVGGDDLRPLGLDLSATPVARWWPDAEVRAHEPAALRRPRRARRRATGARALPGRQRAGATSTCTVRACAPTGSRRRSSSTGPGAGGGHARRRRRRRPAQGGPLAPALLALVQQARGKGWRLVVAGSTAEIGSGYGGWVYELRKARQGLLLSSKSMSDGDIYSLRPCAGLAGGADAPRPGAAGRRRRGTGHGAGAPGLSGAGTRARTPKGGTSVRRGRLRDVPGAAGRYLE